MLFHLYSSQAKNIALTFLKKYMKIISILTKMEVWKQVNMDNILNYECSSYGRLRNKNTNVIFDTKARSSGYISVTVRDKLNKRITIALHILIAKTFIENPDNKPTVDHIDKNRSNNKIENLRWANYTEQALNRNKPKERGIKINQFDLDMNLVKVWPSINKIYLDLCLDSYPISNSCKHKTTYNGYYWRYASDYDDINNEKWKQFFNIEVSDHGRINSRTHINYGCLIKTGYRVVTILGKQYQVHRLVCMLFNDQPTNMDSLFVNHKDGNKENNHYSNLEWCTQKENANHASINGLLNSTEVISYSIMGDKIKEYKSIADASTDNNVPASSISKCCVNRKGSSADKQWRYKEDNIDKLEPLTRKKENKRKKVSKFTLNGEFICSYSSIIQASKYNDCSSTHISDCCNGYSKQAKGFIYKFED